MPITMRISAFGEDVFAREFLRFRDRLLDATPAFEAMADEFYASEQKQFDTEGAWGSGGWKQLAPATVAAKAAAGLDPRILHATLDLERSLTEPDFQSSHVDGGSVRQIRPDEMFIGSNIPYGKFHQQAPYRSDWLPMRKPVELPEQVKIAMVKTMQRFLVGGQPRDELGRFIAL